MNQLWWYLSRATGIVATLLAVVSLVFGAFFSARNTGDRRSPAWWLDLHNYLGGLALAFTGGHIIAAVLDPGSGVGLAQALVPGTAHGSQWAVTFGVLATYTFVIAVFTSWPKRRFSRKVWRALHLTSVAGVALAGVHAIQLGTDAEAMLFTLVCIVAAGVCAYAISLRVFSLVARSRNKARAR